MSTPAAIVFGSFMIAVSVFAHAYVLPQSGAYQAVSAAYGFWRLDTRTGTYEICGIRRGLMLRRHSAVAAVSSTATQQTLTEELGRTP